MGEAFITRRGGIGSEQALAPTITEVSTTDSSITFTITNNDASTAVILYELDDATPDANSIELAAAATSSNIVVTGLAGGTAFDVYATANVTGKVKSNITELEISTDTLIFTAATGGTTEEYDSGGKRFKSHTFTSSGTFTVTTVGDVSGDRNQVDYLIIAGGGAGGGFIANQQGSGGGGGGGYLTTLGSTPSDVTPNEKVTVTTTNYAVTIGAGGVNQYQKGSPSSVAFSTTISAEGGGGGGGGTGGSGGGGSPGGSGGVGILGQGRNGGSGGSGASSLAGGSGGGAGSAASNSNFSEVGAAGVGLANLLRTGLNETRATGGLGGSPFSSKGTDAAANTGNGGGGAGGTFVSNARGTGGSGIVVIRYEIAQSV